MKRDKILTMVPGPELDEAVGKAIGATPEIKWYCMNEEETAYCMDFERENAARDWLSDIVTRFPDSRYVDYHIVRKEIYRQYSKDISAAWKVVEKMHTEGWCHTVNFIQNHYYPQGIQHCCFSKPQAHISAEDIPYITQSEKIFYHGHYESTPEAICKAALLAKEGNGDG